MLDVAGVDAAMALDLLGEDFESDPAHVEVLVVDRGQADRLGEIEVVVADHWQLQVGLAEPAEPANGQQIGAEEEAVGIAGQQPIGQLIPFLLAERDLRVSCE